MLRRSSKRGAHFTAVAICLVGISCAVSPTGASRSIETGGPVLSVVYAGDDRGGGNNGLLAAIWEDGRVLFARGGVPGANIYAGHVAQDHLLALMATIRDIALVEPVDIGFTVPDGDSTTISLRNADAEINLMWDETILPGYGKNVYPDDTYIAFVHRWCTIRILVAGALSHVENQAPIEQTTRDVAGTVWGYNIDNPWETAWF